MSEINFKSEKKCQCLASPECLASPLLAKSQNKTVPLPFGLHVQAFGSVCRAVCVNIKHLMPHIQFEPWTVFWIPSQRIAVAWICLLLEVLVASFLIHVCLYMCELSDLLFWCNIHWWSVPQMF